MQRRTCYRGLCTRAGTPRPSPPPVSDWKHAAFRGSRSGPARTIASQDTVLSGLLCTFPSLWLRSFRSGENPCGVNQKMQNRRRLPRSSDATPTPRQHRHRRVEPTVRSVAGLTAEVVQPSGGIITSSLLIKGEVRGQRGFVHRWRGAGHDPSFQRPRHRRTARQDFGRCRCARNYRPRKSDGRAAGPRARGNRVAPEKSAAILQPCGLPSEKARKSTAKWKSPARDDSQNNRAGGEVFRWRHGSRRRRWP